MDSPRIVCVGSNLESEIVIRGLQAHGINVVALVTLPSSADSRPSDYVDLHEWCASEGIRTIDTTDVNDAATIDAIRSVEPDYIFALGWSQLFRENLLSVPTGYVVGSHPSPLPMGRGRAPVPWTILQGQSRTAVTLFRMDVGVDAGPILLQRWFDVAPDAYARDVYNAVAINLCDAFLELYKRLVDGRVQEKPQDETSASYRSKRIPADGLLDFSSSSAHIYRLVRAVSEPYPGSYAYHEGVRVHIWRAALDPDPRHVGVPGQVLMRQGDRLLVQAKDEPLWVWSFTDDHGNSIPATYFRIGSRFGYRVQDEIHSLRAQVQHLTNVLNAR